LPYAHVQKQNSKYYTTNLDLSNSSLSLRRFVPKAVVSFDGGSGEAHESTGEGQGVACDDLKHRQSLPCPTFLCLSGGHP
jgi:hypothetical protein